MPSVGSLPSSSTSTSSHDQATAASPRHCRRAPSGSGELADAVWSHRLPYSRKLDAIRSAGDPNLLFVGNSLLDHHLDESEFMQAAAKFGSRFVPLNAALGATDPPEQRLLFQYAVAKHPGIRTVVVGIFDFQVTHADH